MTKPNIILFTHEHPSKITEIFLEDELTVLAQRFSHVYIQRLYHCNTIEEYDIPEGVTVLPPLIKSPILFIFLSIFNLSTLRPLKYFFNNLHPKRMKAYLTQLLIVRYILSRKKLIKLINKTKLVYFYWGTNAANITPYLNKDILTISRFHGYDLYENDHRKNNFLFFRKELFKRLNLSSFVSQQGKDYAQYKYSILNPEVNYLGTKDFGKSPVEKNCEILHLVTCSILYPNKQITLLAECLNKVNIPIKWSHIGNGPDQKKIEQISSNFPKNIEFNFLGFLKNKQVKDFYLNNHVDIFVNVSKSEGLPISILEAMSASIPVVAPRIGGIEEIGIPDEYLLSSHFKKDELIKKLSQLKKNKLMIDREKFRGLWEQKFKGNTNYNLFIDKIIKLTKNIK